MENSTPRNFWMHKVATDSASYFSLLVTFTIVPLVGYIVIINLPISKQDKEMGYSLMLSVYAILRGLTFCFTLYSKINYGIGRKNNVHVIQSTLILLLFVVLGSAIDYYVLILFEPGVFHGISGNNLHAFLSFLYFSVITFATVGYGDIYPLSLLAKMLVCIQIITTFLVIGVGLTNYEKLRFTIDEGN